VGRIYASLAECPVCLCFMENPVTIGCGHTFCIGCLEKIAHMPKSNYTCPICRGPVKIEHLAVNVSLKQVILMVYGKSCEWGCPELFFDDSRVKQHATRWVCMINVLILYLSMCGFSECPMRKITCDNAGCNVIFTFSDGHLCDYAPCPGKVELGCTGMGHLHIQECKCAKIMFELFDLRNQIK